MGTCISRCDCSCTRSSSPVLLPQQQQQELPQPTIQDKLVILSSSPLPSTYPLADSSSSSPVKPPPPSSPSLSSTPSTSTTNNRSSSISCTSSTLSRVYASSSSVSSSSTSTYTSSSASSELGRSFSDEFQWSNVRKHPPKPRRTIQPAQSQQQQKAPPEAAAAPVPHKKPPPSWHRVAPTNISPCPQLQKSFRKDQRISSSTRTTSERECVGTRVDDVGKARCSSNNCNAKTHNRRPDGGRSGGRPRDSDKRKERNEKVRQKKTESRVHHMVDVPALQDDDQIGSSHRYCPGEANDNSLVALDCFIFL